MRYGVKFTSYHIKSVYKLLDQTVCCKALQAPSFGGGCVIPITVLYSKWKERVKKQNFFFEDPKKSALKNVSHLPAPFRIKISHLGRASAKLIAQWFSR